MCIYIVGNGFKDEYRPIKKETTTHIQNVERESGTNEEEGYVAYECNLSFDAMPSMFFVTVCK
jgi:hypothetical protein